MKAVILARVSSKEQEDGYSLEAQLANLQAYAQRKDLNIIRTFRVIESSTKGQRPEFEQMIDFIRQQPQRIALIVDCVDRLQRSFTHTPILDALILEDKLEIHFVREGNVLDKEATSSQKLMWNMGVVMAQSYTDQLSDNVKRSVKHKIRKGEWIAKAPLGYLNVLDKETGRNTVILDKERAFLVKKLFTEYATGTVSMHELARKTKNWGLTTAKSNKIHVQTISRILHNPFYFGMMRVKGKLYPHVYHALIDKALFDACEKVYNKSNANTAAPATSDHPFALNGLINCALTGFRVSCDLKKGKYVYLITRDPKNTAKKLWIPEKVVMDQIKAIMHSITIPQAVLEPMVDYLRQSHEIETQHYQDTVIALQQEAGDLTKKLSRLTDCLLDGSITKDMYAQKHDELQNRRLEVNRLLEKNTDADGQFKIALSTLFSLSSRIGELFDSSKPEEKRHLIGFVFSNLSLEGSTLCYSLRKPFDLFTDLNACKEWRAWRDSNPRPDA
jgi:site-specific DNA recombinase